MGETDYSELFGVEPEAPETGAAEGQTAGSEAGANQQGSADPDVKNGTQNGTETTVAGAGDTGSETDGQGQTREENAKYAAARRKAEAEKAAAIEQAKAEAAAEMEDIFKVIGLRDPYTKKPITNREEYQAYKQRFEIEKKAGFMKKSGMTQEEFDAFISNLPEVKEAAQKKAEAEAAAKSAREAQAKIAVDSQISEIGKLDPAITSIQTLADAMRKAGCYDEFYGKVKSGYSLTDAYKLATMDSRTGRNIEQTKQAALNAANSKNHLDRTTTRGAGAVTVPADIIEQYRAFNPDATDAEIQAHYNKYKK